MPKTAIIQARVEPELKEQGEAVLKQIGISTSELITMTFRQLVMQRGLPFEARIPNEETLAAFVEGQEAHKLSEYPTVKAALDDAWDGE